MTIWHSIFIYLDPHAPQLVIKNLAIILEYANEKKEKDRLKEKENFGDNIKKEKHYKIKSDWLYKKGSFFIPSITYF